MPRSQTTKKLKKPNKAMEQALKELPYWPSQKFITESRALLREKGVIATDEELNDDIHSKYWVIRSKILAKLLVP